LNLPYLLLTCLFCYSPLPPLQAHPKKVSMRTQIHYMANAVENDVGISELV
jgi:hypothetical protein